MWQQVGQAAMLLCHYGACAPGPAADVVLSGSEDGTVREVDVRVRPPPLTRAQDAAPASDDANVLGGWRNGWAWF